MERARMASLPVPKNATKVMLVQRSWGIERSYKNNNGSEICTPAPFDRSENS